MPRLNVKSETLTPVICWKYPRTVFPCDFRIEVDEGCAAIVHPVNSPPILCLPGKQSFKGGSSSAPIPVQITFFRINQSFPFFWGTDFPVVLSDPLSGKKMIIKAFGTFLFSIINAESFYYFAVNNDFNFSLSGFRKSLRVCITRLFQNQLEMLCKQRKNALSNIQNYSAALSHQTELLCNYSIMKQGAQFTQFQIGSILTEPCGNAGNPRR